MKATKFIVQSFDGGPEIEFFEVPPARFRAFIALQSDASYGDLPEGYRDFLLGGAYAILSAKKRGLSCALHLPEKVNAKTVSRWMDDYVIGFDDSELPTESGSAADPALKNPTAPKE